MIKYKINKKTKTAQTVLEYTFLVGIVVTIGFVMTPMIKRTTQAMVKMASDQVGAQQNSEQIGGKQGYVVNSTTITQLDESKTKTEDMGEFTYTIVREQDLSVMTHTNLGFIKK